MFKKLIEAFRGDDRFQLAQGLPPERMALHGKATPLLIGEA
jgi:hypothetical protein